MFHCAWKAFPTQIPEKHEGMNLAQNPDSKTCANNKVLKAKNGNRKVSDMFSFAQPRSSDNIRIQKKLLSEMQLFQNHPELLHKDKYTITSDVDPEVVDLFFSRVGGDTDAVVTSENVEQLQELCDELGFAGFDNEIRAVLDEDWRLRKGFLSLRGQVDRHDVIIEEMQRRVLELERQIREQRGVPERVEAVERRVDEIHRSDVAGAVAEAKANAEEAKEEAEKLQVDVRHLESEVARCKSATESAVGPIALDELLEAIAEARKDAHEAKEEAEKLKADVKSLKYEVKKGSVVYNKAKPLDGIIAHLTRECGGNVHEKGFVEVTASSRGEDAKYAVDLGTNSCFGSSDKPNSWIRYDFKGRRVAPTSYSIRTSGHVYAYHPRSWVLEVSNGGSEDWDVVDSRQNNDDLNGPHLIRNFAISAPPSGAFRFVRLRQTGKSTSESGAGGDDTLCIAGLELFGTLSSH